MSNSLNVFSFYSTTAAMEVFALDLSSADMEMPLKGSVPCEHR